jgi:hypothetical protein
MTSLQIPPRTTKYLTDNTDVIAMLRGMYQGRKRFVMQAPLWGFLLHLNLVLSCLHMYHVIRRCDRNDATMLQ